ncbi:MAG: class I SAM-dependent methyltransferase, partial [candidate division KSB1 bacterium]|nr:class I SAM-dependent methyltransferase [candidate division KSB1 bacterium]
RIRTFIPHYEEMLRMVAAMLSLVRRRQPTIIDLGVGSGALAASCLAKVPQACLYGIDTDADMLALARRRLSRKSSTRSNLICGNFLEVPLPRCEAIVTTLALHHLSSFTIKQKFYAKCFSALRRGGIFANGDCFLAENADLNRSYMAIWQSHLHKFYSARQTQDYFEAWAKEDTYLPLAQEMNTLAAVGFKVEVIWRRAPFAVLVGWKN